LACCALGQTKADADDDEGEGDADDRYKHIKGNVLCETVRNICHQQHEECAAVECARLQDDSHDRPQARVCANTLDAHVDPPNAEHDEEGRCVTAEFDKFYLVSVYVPNSGRKLVTLPKRLEWNKAFKTYIKELDKKKPVIVCGDLNVAHAEIDLANPKTNSKNAGFTKEEREGMTAFLGDGYVDTYRKLYPEKTGAYTFWTYMMKSRSKNVGWRLDYFLVSERFMDNICDNVIRSEILGSDHCPIVLFLNV